MEGPFWVVFGAGRSPRACHIEFDPQFQLGFHKDDVFNAVVDLGMDKVDAEDRLKLVSEMRMPVSPQGKPNKLLAWAMYVKPPKKVRIDFTNRSFLAKFIVIDVPKGVA